MLVFVYGTLTDPERTDQLLDDDEYAGAATLKGLHRVDGEYPTLAPGGRVEGRLLRTDEVNALDDYEGVDCGLYVRVTVPVEGRTDSEQAAVYVGDPDRLDAPVEWPSAKPFPACVRSYLADHNMKITTKA